MPCPSTGPKTFWASQKNFWPDQNWNCIQCHSKYFCEGTKTEFILMPCPFTGPKMFWAGANFLCQTKNLFTYYAGSKPFVSD